MTSTIVDSEKWTVTVGDKTYSPQRRTFELIRFLARRPGVIRTRAEIMDELKITLHASDRHVDWMIKRARRGLRDAGIADQIGTRTSVGYYWRE